MCSFGALRLLGGGMVRGKLLEELLQEAAPTH